MTEDGHHDSDVYAVLDEQRRGRVAAVMDSDVSHIRFAEDVLPLFPVVSRIDWTSVRPAENEIAVVPLLAGRESLPELLLAVRFENGNELRWERHGPLALAFRLSEDKTTADALRTDPGVFCAAGRACLRTAKMARLRAIRHALHPVLVSLTALRARCLVKSLPAFARIVTAMAPSRPLNLPPDADLHRVKIDVLPAEPDGLALAEPQSEPYRPASTVRTSCRRFEHIARLVLAQRLYLDLFHRR